MIDKEQILQNTINEIKDIMTRNKQFYMVALNISGRRESLEKSAMKLIDKHGYVKALKISVSESKEIE